MCWLRMDPPVKSQFPHVPFPNLTLHVPTLVLHVSLSPLSFLHVALPSPFYLTPNPSSFSLSLLPLRLSSSAMIKTLSPYHSSTAKTAEIMSRYRPIAPKPEVSVFSAVDSQSISPRISQSAYLRNLWPQLQARPTRTRKRGRVTLSPPTFKRQRTRTVEVSSPSLMAQTLSFRGFAPRFSQLPISNLEMISTRIEMEEPFISPPSVSFPFLSSPPPVSIVSGEAAGNELPVKNSFEEDKAIDLNTISEIPEEKDLLKQLQAPATATSGNVITPQPVRPVGSSISVGHISENPSLPPSSQAIQKPEEVEKDVESEALPAIISDSNNKVRMANSAYKEMVGQPECPWLDSMAIGDEKLGGGSSCKRISGEIMLHLSDSKMPDSSNGHSCWVRIEWARGGGRCSINTFCDVIRLSCESRDYLFAWRFHTRTRESFQTQFLKYEI